MGDNFPTAHYPTQQKQESSTFCLIKTQGTACSVARRQASVAVLVPTALPNQRCFVSWEGKVFPRSSAAKEFAPERASLN